MAKKVKKVKKAPRFFWASPDDPIGGILAEAGNITADKMLRVFSNHLARRLFGAPDTSPEEQFRRDSSRIAIQKQESNLRPAVHEVVS